MSDEDWHPYTEPPSDLRQVILRFDPKGELDCTGFYCKACGAYAKSDQAAAQHRFVHPTHWKELKGKT